MVKLRLYPAIILLVVNSSQGLLSQQIMTRTVLLCKIDLLSNGVGKSDDHYLWLILPAFLITSTHYLLPIASTLSMSAPMLRPGSDSDHFPFDAGSVQSLLSLKKMINISISLPIAVYADYYKSYLP